MPSLICRFFNVCVIWNTIEVKGHQLWEVLKGEGSLTQVRRKVTIEGDNTGKINVGKRVGG